MSSVSHGMDLFRFFYPDPVVSNYHDGTFVRLLSTDDNRTAAPSVQDAVLYGVFYKRLKGKRWDQKILYCNLVNNLKLVAEPLLFQIQIVCRMI